MAAPSLSSPAALLPREPGTSWPRELGTSWPREQAISLRREPATWWLSLTPTASSHRAPATSGFGALSQTGDHYARTGIHARRRSDGRHLAVPSKKGQGYRSMAVHARPRGGIRYLSPRRHRVGDWRG